MRVISKYFSVFSSLMALIFFGGNVYAAPIPSPSKPTTPQPVARAIPDLSHYKLVVENNPWVYGLTPYIVPPWETESGERITYGGDGQSSTAGIRFKTPAGTRCVIVDWFGPRCVQYIYSKTGEDISHGPKSGNASSLVVIGCREAKIEFILFHNEKTPGTISTLPRQHCDVVYHPENTLFYNDNYPLLPIGDKISAYDITCAVAVNDRITCMNSFHHGFVFATGHDQTF